jgi:hypothetical protein
MEMPKIEFDNTEIEILTKLVLDKLDDPEISGYDMIDFGHILGKLMLENNHE